MAVSVGDAAGGRRARADARHGAEESAGGEIRAFRDQGGGGRASLGLPGAVAVVLRPYGPRPTALHRLRRSASTRPCRSRSAGAGPFRRARGRRPCRSGLHAEGAGEFPGRAGIDPAKRDAACGGGRRSRRWPRRRRARPAAGRRPPATAAALFDPRGRSGRKGMHLEPAAREVAAPGGGRPGDHGPGRPSPGMAAGEKPAGLAKSEVPADRQGSGDCRRCRRPGVDSAPDTEIAPGAAPAMGWTRPRRGEGASGNGALRSARRGAR